MDAEYAVYDTIYLRFVGGVSTDQAALQTEADALSAATGRVHVVKLVQAAESGGGVTGPAAWFDLSADDNTVPSTGKFTFSAIDDGRAVERPDLIVVNAEDDTLLDVLMDGNYEIVLMSAPRANGGTVTTPGDLGFIITTEVNAGSEAPAYYPVARIPVNITDTGFSTDNRASATLVIAQPLEAGDTLSIGVNTVLGDVEGTDILWASGDSYLSVRRIGD